MYWRVTKIIWNFRILERCGVFDYFWFIFVFKDKLREFENAEADFEQCKLALLKGNELMENDSEELITANRTIAHEEGILELLRDDLSLFQSLR